MFSTRLDGFRKSEDCPSSHELLLFQNGDIARTRGGEVRRHLKNCEFCEAEVEFYSHYPQEEGASEAVEIPGPLYQLAEALLKNKACDPASLNTLLRDRNESVLDKV